MFFKFVLISCFFILKPEASLECSSRHPVDISFLVADLKYSEENGIKICEIQQGILSTFLGDAYLRGIPGPIAMNFHEVLSEFSVKKWTAPRGIASWNIIRTVLNDPDWKLETSLRSILSHPEFPQAAKLPPENPFDISSYKAIVFVRTEEIEDRKKLKELYPGIIAVDAANSPYWIDKYKMSLLFERNPTLSAIKPEWKLYDKTDPETLARKVMEDISSELYVIKPRGAFLGNGVIISAREELEATFRTIFSGEGLASKSKDPSYSYWSKDPFDSFIVEKFYYSDFIEVPEFGGEIYNPTIRAAFILVYDKGKIEFRMLGSYGLLPFKPICGEGSLNECHKAYCKQPFFTELNLWTRQQVEKQLSETMPLLYREMLSIDTAYVEPAIFLTNGIQ